jgi:SAM-dependent methyltransferase
MLIKEYNKKDINRFYNLSRKMYDNTGRKKGYEFSEDESRSGKVGWTDRSGQIKRYQDLLDIGVQNNDSILDFGCGLGDLYGYTKKINLNVDYIGVDINEDHIADAKDTYESKLRHVVPFQENNCIFQVIDTIDDVRRDFDWFLASGSFTIGFNMEEIMEVLDKAYYKSHKGMAFNLLIKKEIENFWVTRYYGATLYSPDWVLEKLRSKYSKVYSKDCNLPSKTKTFGIIDDYTFYIKK